MKNIQKLVPDYYRNVHVPTETNLIFLGSKNLEFLKRYWRRKERETTSRIRAGEERIKLLDGKTVDDIKAIATKYEHPEFPKIGVRGDNWLRDPEPLDADSINREPGTTTLNFCGWCDYCGSGTCRYNYHITTNCTLIPEESEFRFNTPCAISNGTQELLEKCVKYLKSNLAQSVERKAEIGRFIRFILRVIKQAEEKPYLAYWRPGNWFEIGDKAVCFISDDFKDAIKTGIFVTGKVINGYRHGNGFVSICADERIRTGSNGYEVGYGISRPEILHKWEYEYLKSHPDYLKVWLNASADLPEFNPDEMAEAFK